MSAATWSMNNIIPVSIALKQTLPLSIFHQFLCKTLPPITSDITNKKDQVPNGQLLMMFVIQVWFLHFLLEKYIHSRGQNH